MSTPDTVQYSTIQQYCLPVSMCVCVYINAVKYMNGAKQDKVVGEMDTQELANSLTLTSPIPLLQTK